MIEKYDTYDERYVDIISQPIIHYRVKIEALDHYENTLGEFQQDIDIQNAGSISCTYNQGVRRTCTITLRNIFGNYLPNEDSPFFINRKFRLLIGVKSDIDEVYWWSQGIFITTEVSAQDGNVTISGIDKFGYFTSDLKQYVLQTAHVIPAGTSVYDCIRDTITLDMGDSRPIDPIEPIIEEVFTQETFPYEIKKDAGTTLGDILEEMATALNADIYYDRQGRLNVRKLKTDDYQRIAPSWTFDDVKLSVNYAVKEAVNQVMVMGNNTSMPIYSYTAKNTNLQSPFRQSLIGVKAKEPVETPMGYCLERCKDYAEYLINKASMIGMSVSFSTPVLPHISENDIIWITSKEYSLENTPFVVNEISQPIGAGQTQYSVTNVQYLPFQDESRVIF